MKIGRYLLVFVIIMTAVIVISKGGYVDYCNLNDKLATLREENARITRENEALKEQVVLLGSDLDYIERIAREELGLVRTDEMVYRFIDEHPQR